MFSLTNNTKRTPPKLPFEEMKDAVLGKRYELSLVLCGNKLSQRLNKAFRKKDKPTNVLSFPLSGNSGEIFINLAKLGPFKVEELFIHGLLHLNGMEHGDTMEKAEIKFLKKFSNNDKAPRSRNRHRKLPDEGDHRRRIRGL